ncbi:FkbM family methyltransferase [Synechocystis sp. B12]|nr:FkbM family methyltransferase [Synechocystis sp. B12]
MKINAFSGEAIGRSIAAMGVYDLCVSESLWRLIDNREICVDVGANIGYMTSIMAYRVGLEGKVIAFEPHPDIYQLLINNVQYWDRQNNWQQIQINKLGISNQSGQASLFIPINFNKNQGTASLDNSTDIKHHNLNKKITINTDTLDNLFEDTTIQVLKLDVEGHELNVLLGAQKMILENRIRDIIFEEHHPYPNPVSEFLTEQGYSVFRITKGFFKPNLKSPQITAYHPWEPPCYLATKDVDRSFQRFKQFGWHCLKSNLQQRSSKGSV